MHRYLWTFFWLTAMYHACSACSLYSSCSFCYMTLKENVFKWTLLLVRYVWNSLSLQCYECTEGSISDYQQLTNLLAWCLVCFLLLNVWLIQFVSEALWSEQTFRSHSGVQVVHWFFSEIKPCYSENGLIVTYSLRNSLLGKSKEINHLKYLLSQQVCRNQWAIWAYPTASSVTQTNACSVVDTDLC